MKANEPTKVGGRDGWRARLKCANDEAGGYLMTVNQLREENLNLRAAIGQKNAQIQALDEFGATMVEVVQDYHKGRLLHG